ncbi:MAG: ROK family protein [Luteitalea sp.]|nr:ROK family protein [Luteitalea sp.]
MAQTDRVRQGRQAGRARLRDVPQRPLHADPHPRIAEGKAPTTILAADLGGTRIKLGIVRDAAVLARETFAAESQDGLARQLPKIAAAFATLCDRASVDMAECTAVGFCYPGLTDPGCRRVVAAYGKYTDAPTLDLVAWGREYLALPVWVENDARVALLGEWQFGAGRGCDDLVMVTLGTGIGAVAMIEGRLRRGRHGQAGVLGGHFTVRLGGRRCRCGNIGCAETEASNAYLPAIAREWPGFAESRLAAEPVIDYATVFRLAGEGEACAVAIRTHSVQVWGAVIVNLIHAFDPVRVIVGGGVMASADTILPALRDYVSRHAHTPWGTVEVVASALGDDFALFGCEVLLRERMQPTGVSR